MKKLLALSLFAAAIATAAGTSSADWFGSDDNECWTPYGDRPGCNPYDEWDPRYWMEEMEQEWDDISTDT